MHEAAQVSQVVGSPAGRHRVARPRARRGLTAAGLFLGALVVGVAPASADGTAYVTTDVECDQANRGVLDLTLVNDSDTVPAEFVVGDADPAKAALVTVAPLSAHAMTYTELADGDITVPVRIDGAEADVAVTIDCAGPRVESLSAPAHIVGGVTPELPRTGSSTVGLVIGGALVVAGIAASLIARRRYS